MATLYTPDPVGMVFPAESAYTPPAGTNVVLDVASGDDILRYVAGTVEVSGFPAGRELLAVSYLKQDIPGEGQKRVVLASGNSQPTDGAFAMDVGYFSEPVLVIALDDYGSTWSPNTAYSAGAIVHPADPAHSTKGLCTSAFRLVSQAVMSRHGGLMTGPVTQAPVAQPPFGHGSTFGLSVMGLFNLSPNPQIFDGLQTARW